MKIRRPSGKNKVSTRSRLFLLARRFTSRFIMPPRLRFTILTGMVLTGLVLAGFYTGWAWMCQSKIFRVSKVKVQGCSRLTEEEVLNLSQVTPQDNLLSLDLKSIESSIETHPWVRAAEVKKMFPDHLQITVHERIPVALLSSEKIYLVDSSGTIFGELSPGNPLSLPIITGVDSKYIQNGSLSGSSLKALELIALASKGTRTLGVNNVSQVHVTGDGRLVLYTVDGGVPFYFDAQDLRAQFYRAEKVLYQLYRSGMYDRVAKIDLDYGPGWAWASMKH